MKQETKRLIDWIKKQINIAKTDHIDKAWNGHHECYNEDYDKAMRFLDSIPEIESHICKGGYIQDRNGTPCCDGDKVKIIRGGDLPPHITTLRFDSEIKTFVIGMPVFGENEEVNMLLERHEFEKVE